MIHHPNEESHLRLSIFGASVEKKHSNNMLRPFSSSVCGNPTTCGMSGNSIGHIHSCICISICLSVISSQPRCFHRLLCFLSCSSLTYYHQLERRFCWGSVVTLSLSVSYGHCGSRGSAGRTWTSQCGRAIYTLASVLLQSAA